MWLRLASKNPMKSSKDKELAAKEYWQKKTTEGKTKRKRKTRKSQTTLKRRLPPHGHLQKKSITETTI